MCCRPEWLRHRTLPDAPNDWQGTVSETPDDGELGLAPAASVRVRTYPGLCAGQGECNRRAPDVYPLDERGHIAVHMVDVEGEHAEAAFWGALGCPQQAITLIGPPEHYWFERLRQRNRRTTQWQAMKQNEEQTMTALDIDINDTLADLVSDNPLRASVLERWNLDYCCHGATRLADACAERELDPDAVVAELLDVQPAPSVTWSSLPPGELADHIEETHHAYLHHELPRLSALVAKVAAVHGERHPELHDIQQTYEELRADFEPHLLKEERVLFPMIRELAGATEVPEFHCGTLRNPIAVMMAEHDRAGELLGKLRELTADYRAPNDACASYRVLFGALARLEGDTHLHVHKENNVLFPAVVALESSFNR